MTYLKKETKEQFEHWCQLLYETIHLPILLLDKQLSVKMMVPQASGVSLALLSFLNQFEMKEEPYNHPVMRTIETVGHFVTIVVGQEEDTEGILVIGPCRYSPSTSQNTDTTSIPVIDRHTFLHAALLASSLFTSKQLSITDMIYHEAIIANAPKSVTKEDYELEISKSRQDISFHATYQWERMTLRCVKEGNKEELLVRLETPNGEGRIGVLSKQSDLRNEKNLLISTITLATRYAIEGGLHPETAYTMSDYYIQGAEEIRTIEEVKRYSREALCDFTDRVNQSKHLRYTAPIIKCQSYIYKHLYEDVSLNTLAKIVNLHPNYLSTLFKKEVGLAPTEYILQEKIAEAKKLLKYTDYPLSEIYTWLNFHDQSHFTKVFKKYTGMTPKQFKLTESMTAF